jgi:hypothetical protein
VACRRDGVHDRACCRPTGLALRLDQPGAHQFPEQVARRVPVQATFSGDLDAVARPFIREHRQNPMLARGQPQPSPVVWAGGIARQAIDPTLITAAPTAWRRLETPAERRSGPPARAHEKPGTADCGGYEVEPVILDQLPIDGVAEQIVHVSILRVFARAEERQILPVADPRHQLDSEQKRERMDWG